MKTEKVLGVVVMVLIGLFICITVDFSLILASTISRIKIASQLILNTAQDTMEINEIEPDKNWYESSNSQNSDFLNLMDDNNETEDFTPTLYNWLWEK